MTPYNRHTCVQNVRREAAEGLKGRDRRHLSHYVDTGLSMRTGGREVIQGTQKGPSRDGWGPSGGAQASFDVLV